MKYKFNNYASIIKDKDKNVTLLSLPYIEEIIELSDKSYIAELDNIKKMGGVNNIDNIFLETLLNYNILTQDIYKEKKKLDAFMKQALDETIILTIMPTEKCNFRCKYCYEEFPDYVLDEIDYETILNFIKNRLENNLPKQITIKWFGGEPLLEKENLIKFNKQVLKLSKEHKIPFYSNITTNGYLLDKKCAEELLNIGVNRAGVTIDGFKHNSLRPLKNGEPTLNKIIENIKGILQTDMDFNIVIRINITEDDFNMDFYDLFLEYKEDHRLSFLVRPVGQWGEEKLSLNLIKVNDINKKLKEHYLYLKENKYNIYELLSQNNISNYSILSRACPAVFNNGYVVRGNGDILKCTLDLDKEYNRVGKIDRVKKEFIINNAAKKDWENIGITSSCEKCSSFLSCNNKQCPKNLMNNKENKCIFTQTHITMC